MTAGTARVIAGYQSAADALAPRYDSLDSAAILAPVLHDMRGGLRTALDVGAGTGRDAAYLASLGVAVTAVEPVAAFRSFGAKAHVNADICWIDDQLPRLTSRRLERRRFDLVLLNGVWHHLCPRDRRVAMPRLADLLCDRGRLILALRHGPTPKDRPGWPVSIGEARLLAARSGLRVIAARRRASLQSGNRSAGIRWTWLILARR